MSFLNYSTKEINFKIVYFGPFKSGKTTNMKVIYEKVKSNTNYKLISLTTDIERTGYFDFFPLDLGKVKGYKVKLHLYSVPGFPPYSASRRLILKGVDGVVFVADSEESRYKENIESLNELFEHIENYNIIPETLGYVLQLNKVDLPYAIPANELTVALRQKREPVIEATACNGDGVIDTLRAISKIVMLKVRKKLE